MHANIILNLNMAALISRGSSLASTVLRPCGWKFFRRQGQTLVYIMTNAKKSEKNVEKEDLLQAVVVVDDFDGVFSDFTEDGSGALLPVANFHVVDYTLECLGRCGFQETILFCSSHAQSLKEHLKKSPWRQPSSTMNVSVVVSENCQSLGDALRDVDNKAIIKGNFVLLSSFTITNLNLVEILKHHKQTCTKDKGAAMTVVLQDTGSRNPALDDSIYVVNAVSNRLLMHVKSSSKIGKFEIPLEHLVDNVNLNLYSNLTDTGIAICSPSVPLLFSDNFDFQSKEDFIRGLLINEEILDSRIYCYQVENGYGATIRNWQSFQRVNLDCIHRWTFPLVPDQTFTSQEPFSHHRHCVYKQPGVQLLSSVKLEMDVVVGAFTQIGQNTTIVRSVIGSNCIIGQNVTIKDSFILNNTVIADNCTINLCVIGEKSRVQTNSELKQCLLKKKVNLGPNTHLEEASVLSEPLGKKWKKLGDSAYLHTRSGESGAEDELSPASQPGLVDPSEHYSEDEEDEVSSVSNGERSYSVSPEPDDTQLFYSEVVDSLQRGFEEKLSCDNLILEINSSRYAYNVGLSDVTVLTLKGILLLPSRVSSTVKELLSYFLPLLKNYIKTCESQMECLDLMEEICEELGNDIAKCLHFLYDKDILSEDNILKWHEELEKDSAVASKVAPLIKWLKEAAEESSSEEESE